jgi:hypothetical protein
MGMLLAWLVALVAVGVPVAAAMILRKRHLMSQRRLFRDGVVVAAAAVGLAIAVVITRAMATPDPEPRTDRVFTGLCATPAAGDDGSKAFHALACSPTSRVADLRGTSEYQGVWVHLVANDTSLAVFAPRPDLVPDVPSGKGYRLWLLDRAGTVVDNARLDRSMATLIKERPHVAEAVKAVITVEVPAATKPTGSVIAQGTLAPLAP